MVALKKARRETKAMRLAMMCATILPPSMAPFMAAWSTVFSGLHAGGTNIVNTEVPFKRAWSTILSGLHACGTNTKITQG